MKRDMQAWRLKYPHTEPSSDFAPKWNLSTTPHSGTRYIRDTFIAAGLKTTTQRATKFHKELPSDFLWGHCDRGHDTWMEKVHTTWPDIRDFIVLRDPMYIMATHYNVQQIREKSFGAQTHALRHIGNSLALYCRMQSDFIDMYDPHIHKVEDPIELLGEWAGVELKDDSDRRAKTCHTYALKEAVDARDLGRIFEIVHYSNLMDWFITDYSAMMAPLYRDQMGYDFWWYNG